MSKHTAVVEWMRGESDFLDGLYSRVHRVLFDGGVSFDGSASPGVVKPPMASAAAVDPEEMFVAALSSCHMLTFLYAAQRAGFRVDHYVDHAEGELGRNAEGRMAVTRVTLRPAVSFHADHAADEAQLAQLHEKAHHGCFIANSVNTEVRVEPR
ncbi:MAG: OsmC family protein [Proteobacteria bacterium]|nr:OsmC family protein [Pseudomonadota bacterium]MBW3618126.1 OsmC family protein [Pseudomonadota bacterium]